MPAGMVFRHYCDTRRLEPAKNLRCMGLLAVWDLGTRPPTQESASCPDGGWSMWHRSLKRSLRLKWADRPRSWRLKRKLKRSAQADYSDPCSLADFLETSWVLTVGRGGAK